MSLECLLQKYLIQLQKVLYVSDWEQFPKVIIPTMCAHLNNHYKYLFLRNNNCKVIT